MKWGGQHMLLLCFFHLHSLSIPILCPPPFFFLSWFFLFSVIVGQHFHGLFVWSCYRNMSVQLFVSWVVYVCAQGWDCSSASCIMISFRLWHIVSACFLRLCNRWIMFCPVLLDHGWVSSFSETTMQWQSRTENTPIYSFDSSSLTNTW